MKVESEAFCNTFDLLKAIIGVENQFLVFLRVAVLHRFYCIAIYRLVIEPRHEISSNVVCATIKASDQTAHTRILIRAFASRLNILEVLSY